MRKEKAYLGLPDFGAAMGTLASVYRIRNQGAVLRTTTNSEELLMRLEIHN